VLAISHRPLTQNEIDALLEASRKPEEKSFLSRAWPLMILLVSVAAFIAVSAGGFTVVQALAAVAVVVGGLHSILTAPDPERAKRREREELRLWAASVDLEETEAVCLRCTATDVVAFESIGGEAPAWAFDTGDGTFLLLHGEPYVETDEFPNTHFEAVYHKKPDHPLSLDHIMCMGEKLSAAMVVPAIRTAGLPSGLSDPMVFDGTRATLVADLRVAAGRTDRGSHDQGTVGDDSYVQ
jgi:hypothetical protein